MTRPNEIKPREGEQPGTFAEEFVVGAELPELRFTISPEIVSEYITAIDGDASVYTVDGRAAAPPNVLAVYLLAVLYRRFPPAQGIILAKQHWDFFTPIWADEDTEVVARGTVLRSEVRRDKNFLRWSAEFTLPNGTPIAIAENELYVPTPGEGSDARGGFRRPGRR